VSALRRLLRHAVIDVAPLRRHRDFRLLFLGQLATFLGSMLTFVAIPYQVYALTESSLTVGLLGLAELVPVLALGLLGGALADVIDRRKLVLLSELALMAMSGVLVWNSTFTLPSVVVIFGVAVVSAGAWSLQRPALDALLPRLVERDELTAAGALSTFQGTVGMLAGPALGGVLVASVGLAATYGIDVATFGVSLALLWAMRAVPPPADARRVSVSGIVEGLRYARSRPELMGTYIVDMSAMFFGMPMALFPQVAHSYGGAGVLGCSTARRPRGRWWPRPRAAGRRTSSAKAAPWCSRPPSGGSARSRSASPGRSGSRCSASPWPVEPTRSVASSAARSGTRRSPTSSAAGSRASR
jgi:MFS family permease